MKPPKSNVVELAKVREANQLAKGSLGAHLRVLASEADAGNMANIVMAWTMNDGTIHYGYAHFEQSEPAHNDNNLRMLGLTRVIEETLVDILTAEFE